MHENRETSSSAARQRSSPAGKGDSRRASMNDGEESDGVTVPMISSNKATEKQAGAAEREEGRRPTKENIGQHQTGRREEREEPESFTFLGFTHRCGINGSGRFTIWRHTARKRLEAKLQAVKQTLHDRMHEPVPKVGEWLGRVLTGHFQYFAVPGNFSSMYRFRERVGRYWRRALERRSQRGRLTASRIARLFDRWLPQRRVLRPYPDARFNATHPR